MMKTRESSQTYAYFLVLLSPIIILLFGAWYFPQTNASVTINLSWNCFTTLAEMPFYSEAGWWGKGHEMTDLK